MITSEESTQQLTKTVYSVPAPDTSNITATVQQGIATIVYGGTALIVPVEAMPALTALTATVGANIQPIAPDETPVDEETPLESPEEPTTEGDS